MKIAVAGNGRNCLVRSSHYILFTPICAVTEECWRHSTIPIVALARRMSSVYTYNPTALAHVHNTSLFVFFSLCLCWMPLWQSKATGSWLQAAIARVECTHWTLHRVVWQVKIIWTSGLIMDCPSAGWADHPALFNHVCRGMQIARISVISR